MTHKKAMFAGGIHHGIRNELFKRKIPYHEVAPNAVKKFVNVTGWEGEKGSKKRLTGKEKKKAVMNAVKEHFGFSHSSDNVVDAYLIAQISRMIHCRNSPFVDITKYQAEVINAILNPSEKKVAK
ncbi:hypothetical protein [Metabacillus halosaccharovorans]|uniref:hypothetical protein n=1 Tax=Metabacillus halosaccharovorans TaxID=930124 RepID=UPI003183BF26